MNIIEAIPFTETPSYDRNYTEGQFTETMSDPQRAAQFKALRRKIRYEGTTFGRLHESFTTNEAVGRGQDLINDGWVPEVFFQQILEGTQYRQIARQIANVQTAPEGQPNITYREFERFLEAQIVGEDDEIKARKGERKTQTLDFVTIGDRIGFTWQTLKDYNIDQVGQELRAVGASISHAEDKLMMSALYRATTGTNSTTYDNYESYSLGNAPFPFLELLRRKVRMSAPTTTTHPNQSQITNEMLLNIYEADTILCDPETYEDLVTTDNLANQLFWRSSTVLDQGKISGLYGMTIYRAPIGYFTDQYEWIPQRGIYFIDTKLGGVDLVFKENLQLVDWPTYENRRQNTMVYERVNAIVRNRRTIFRLDLMGS